jgi:hypothetical protein
VKTALKEKRFQHVESIMENMTAELNAVPFEDFAVFKNVLNDRRNTFKQAEVILNRNKTIFDFLVFFISFFTPVRELYCQTT